MTTIVLTDGRTFRASECEHDSVYGNEPVCLWLRATGSFEGNEATIRVVIPISSVLYIAEGEVGE